MGDKHQNGKQMDLRENQGYQETDAAHRRFLQKDGELAEIFCKSCQTKFHANCMLTIIEHYGNTKHLNFYKNCLYCQGHVHLYYKEGQTQYYHDCYRWKRGLDQ